MYRVLIGVLAILLANATFALDSEYKNTLNKVELNKTSDASYNINLYTSKEYNEPVKVIKKNDLNYYILLPETKNSASVALPSGLEVKSVNTQLFPYADSNVNNGYTKINIVTSKPINFTINTKTKIASKPKAPETELKKEETKPAAETQAQKKNSAVLAQKVDAPAKTENTKTAQKQETKPVTSKENKNTLAQEAKPKIKELKHEVAAAAKIITDKKEEIKNKQPVKAPEIKQETVKTEETPKEEPAVQNTEENISENQETQVEKEDKTAQEKEIEVVRELPVVHNSPLSKLKAKLLEYGLSLRELLLMIFAGILSFIIMLLILTRQKENQTRLKSKAEFIEKTQNKNSTLVAKKPKKENENKYFIFDKNVKQTGFSAPVSGNKNYELSSYSPIPEDKNAKVEPYVSKRVKSEYDIIQNILKEDAFIELTDNEIMHDIEPVEETSQEIKHEQSEMVKEPEVADTSNNEPQILSSVEIAPQRGFMCVSYNNTINLMGYIFDDIFALYNFGQPKLENYNIKFRISDKTKQGANFLVRVGKSKMLISVTKSSMSLEVAM